MNDAKTYQAITDPLELAAVQRKLAALIDDNGHLKSEWLSQHQWAVAPVWGSYDWPPDLAQRAAAVAKQLSQEWFIACAPPSATSSDPLTPRCYRAPVYKRGLMDVAWEWFPSLEHVVTTENLGFAIVNPIETWYLISGPISVAEGLLGCSLDQAWANFGKDDAPFFDNELEAIRSELLRYREFFGTDAEKTIGGRPL